MFYNEKTQKQRDEVTNGWFSLFSPQVEKASVSLRTADASSLLCFHSLGMVMMRGLYPSIPALLAIPDQPIERLETRMTSVIPPHCRGFWGAQKKLGSCSWWLFDLSLSRAGNLYLYLYCCWSFSSFLFFTLFFPNTADETHSLFRIRQNFSPWEYGIAQGQGPVLFGAGMTGLSVIPKMWGHEKAV